MAPPAELRGDAAALLPVAGFRVAAAACGIRYRGRDDLALIEVAEQTAAAAVFTRNRFCAAPVVVAGKHLAREAPRYLLINAGNANAGTGEAGIADAETCCAELARLAGVAPHRVLPFSTGVIGEQLPCDKITAQLPGLLAALSEDGWLAAARAIMTTDTMEKWRSCRVACGGGEAVLTGIAKGAGMICPDMATMLAFVATDLQMDAQTAQELLREACALSFNSITVDGDTSTNDACVLLASGRSGVRWRDLDDAGRGRFAAALNGLMQDLAKAIVRDAEGATRLIAVDVRGAASVGEARAVAYTVAHSPLVKTACYAGDPNWGRIIAAVGRSPVEGLDVSRIVCYLDEHRIFSDGAQAAGYDERRAAKIMSAPEFTIRIELGRGDAAAVIWTSDLTEDYVKINADYRT